MRKMANKIMKISFNDISLFPRWTLKKMAFVAILIAISVSFAIVVVQIMPLVIIPSFKISFISLPIKITGFIFGPWTGLFVGLISDFLSILFVPPVGYNFLYTVAAGINGFIPGVFSVYFMYFLKESFSLKYKVDKINHKIKLLGVKYQEAKLLGNLAKAHEYSLQIINYDQKRSQINKEQNNSLLMNINLLVSIIILTLSLGIILSIINYSPQDIINRSFITDKRILFILMSFGSLSMMLFVIFGRFKFKAHLYNTLLPIISFSAILELANLPILSYADLFSFGGSNKEDVFIWLTQHILLSPIKIWFNIFVVYFSYIIIYRIINKNSALSYK
ncbi:hypothetical protein CO229_02340 [Mycoplasmopsis bovirhinis]|uniref:folate family ECF transporter S component n=1 Tax=Mycoplasmopsis bovirhinis TaxID=29553 RepID=UPI000C05931A|nr:folate family ECF transporter S component [Mycoplasmopsis bovirhinis]ATO30943.1 hypothetical protein CO229_02340 [Mycoplasmopsis bovirhinis]